MEWQPIETAPKDGTDVLVMYVHIDTQCIFNAFYASLADGWDHEDEGWWSYEHSEVSRIKLDGLMTPTHWMPLPPLPVSPSAPVDRPIRTTLANAIAREITRQDEGDASLVLDDSLCLPWLDQGEVDFGLVADAALNSLGIRELVRGSACAVRPDLERKDAALAQCAEQFAFYAREHTVAGKTEKAATNQRFADLARAAIGDRP